jgi:hypothetical protein
MACKSYFSVLAFLTNDFIFPQLVSLTAIPFTFILASTVYSLIYRLYLWASCLLSVHHRCVQTLLLPIDPFYASFIECEFYDHSICTYLCHASMYCSLVLCPYNIHKTAAHSMIIIQLGTCIAQHYGKYRNPIQYVSVCESFDEPESYLW